MSASLDWVAPGPRVRAGEKGRLEWRHVPDLSPHPQDLHPPPRDSSLGQGTSLSS